MRAAMPPAAAPTSASRPLPGFFWGALGCLTVLGVGLSIVFVVVKPRAGTPSNALLGTVSLTPTANFVAPGHRAGIQVEPLQMNPPAAPPAPAPAPAKPKLVPHAVKVAHSQGGHSRARTHAATDDGEADVADDKGGEATRSHRASDDDSRAAPGSADDSDDNSKQ